MYAAYANFYADVVAGMDNFRPGINLRGIVEYLPMHAPLDDAVVLHKVEGEDSENERTQDDECGDGCTDHGIF